MRSLIERIVAEKFEVEVSDRYDRDVLEDAAVGAYIAAIDGQKLEPARALVRAVRGVGFRTPLWALADSRRMSQTLAPDVDRRGRRLHLSSASRRRRFYAKQVVASVDEYGLSLLPPFFGGLMAYDAEANISFACPGIRAASSIASRPPASCSSSTSANRSSATTSATPTSISAIC